MNNRYLGVLSVKNVFNGIDVIGLMDNKSIHVSRRFIILWNTLDVLFWNSHLHQIFFSGCPQDYLLQRFSGSRTVDNAKQLVSVRFECNKQRMS